jgi:hypothetical protein
MKRSNIKTAFGGEVPFTKFISANSETQARLLEALNLAIEDGFTVQAEDPTEDSKRVDLVVRDSEGTVLLVIESQDATGWLDSVHSSKIMYYMWDKGCDQGVILTEDADEYIMSFVRSLNTDHNFSITLLKTVVYITDEGNYVDFFPLIRGSDIEYSTSSRTKAEPDPQKASLLQELANNNPGLFTNVTGRYASHIRLGKDSMNVGIVPYKNGRFWVDIWHGGKHNTDSFRSTFQQLCESEGLEAKFQQARAYCNSDGGFSASEGIRVFKIFMEALKSNQIYS